RHKYPSVSSVRWSQTIPQLKKLDVEILGWRGYTWSAVDILPNSLKRHWSWLMAAAYGKCVTATTTGRQELRKDLCVKEFDALKTCIVTAAKKGVK
uniref:Uncharacterized protein n=1 Tax=Oncorhynchus tshawytscha TaxID=74940 RepID=A0AAZ3NX65_ONCTS